MADKYSKSFILYKAKNDGNGAASQWSLGSKKDCVFLEMANQKGKDKDGNANFDWPNKISFKLGESDLGELLTVLMGIKDGVGPIDQESKKHKGLFHSNPKGNAVLYFGYDKNRMLRIHLSVKRDDQKTVVRHAISEGEACILRTLLCRAIEVMYGWND
ncbi:hypothetical protein LCGC14_0141680 [marine sediment metagenome]|uniref:Uncharacterized protein n=1 Tax=marine sediment metagenome TaxID=412755 RepID=A0A0F9Y2P0_9ZZZZ